MNRIPVAAAMILTASLALTTGCATKKSVARETAPLINKTNELDDLTAKTTRDIKDLDARSTKGIADVNTKTDAADQKATAARQQADAANELATKAATGVESLTNQVVNLDNYRPVAETAVHFGFNKADLTKKAKDALDKLAAEVANTKGYIVALEGNTDSVGNAEYNYQLSQRRAQSVIQYLAGAQHSSAQDLCDRPWQGQAGRQEQHCRRSRGKPPSRSSPHDQRRGCAACSDPEHGSAVNFTLPQCPE